MRKILNGNTDIRCPKAFGAVRGLEQINLSVDDLGCQHHQVCDVGVAHSTNSALVSFQDACLSRRYACAL